MAIHPRRAGSCLASLLLLASIAPVSAAQGPATDPYGDSLPDGAIARLGSVRFHNPSGLIAMDYSPDGKTILAVGGDSMRFWDAETGKELARHGGGKDGRFSHLSEVRFTPDGTQVAINRGNGVELLDRKTGTKIREFKIGNGVHQTLSFAITPDGKQIAIGSMEWQDDNPIRVWEVETGKELTPFAGRGVSLTHLRFSADGKRLFSGPPGGGYTKQNSKTPIPPFICVWDVETRKLLREIKHHLTSVGFAPTGDLLAYEDDGIRVVAVDSGETVCTVPAKQASFVFTADGKTIAALDPQRELALWDAKTGKQIRRFSGYLSHGCRLAAFSPNGKRLAVIDGGWAHDGSIRQWDVASGDEIRVVGGHEDAILNLAFSPNGKLVASASLDGSVRIWDASTGKELHRLDGHRMPRGVAFSPDGKILASTGEVDPVYLWDVANGQLLGKLDPGIAAKDNFFWGDRSAARAFGFAADGKTLTLLHENHTLITWDVVARKERSRLTLRAGFPNRSVLVPLSDMVLTAEGTGALFGEEGTPETLQLWQRTNGKLVREMPLRGGAAQNNGTFIICGALAASSDGRLLASSQIMQTQGLRVILSDPVMRIWERYTGKEVLAIKESMGQAIAFSPDGRMLAADDGDKSGWGYRHDSTVSLWDTITGNRLCKISGHAAPIHCIAFAPDGKTFATGSADHTVLVWKTPTLKTGVSAGNPDAKQLEAWWKALAGADAVMAHQSAARLVANAETAVPVIRKNFKPAVPIDAKKIPPLIDALDSADFEVRQAAVDQLTAMGDLAEPALRKALEKPASLEARRRLEMLLDRATGMTAEYLQALRAFAVLERIGSPEARRVVAEIAQGAPGTRVTAEAHVVLARMPAK